MKPLNVIGNILCAVVLCAICVLGLTGCGDSGPTPADVNSGPAPAPAPAPGALTITTTSLPNGTVGQAYSASLVGSGGTVPYTWSVSPALRANLSLNATSGVITGTPTTQGTTSHTFTLRDSSNPPQTVQKTLSLTINAAPANTHHLSVNKSGNGTVTSSPSGISCGTTCEADFAINSTVTLTAAPAAGSTFTGWSGAGCSGTGTCAVVMNADQTVAASFATPNTFTLTVNKAGVGLGTVTSSPAGIDCGATCGFAFPSGTPVTLTATPSAGSSFGGWSGSGCSGTGTCAVVMSQNRTVTATFNAVPSVLTVNKAGTGTGSVTSNPAGINCGNACITDNGTFPTGSSVTLTASAASGSVFDGWSGGGCSGTGTCMTVMATDQTVVATFNTVPIPLAITTGSLPDAEVGKPYDKPVQLSGGVAPFTWSVTPPPTLPDGLSLEVATCDVTDKPACHVVGTPAVGTDGDYTLTFTVQDSSTPTPQTDSRAIALKIKP